MNPNPLSTEACKHQHAQDRFSGLTPAERPRINAWRHSLTALSQEWNLYFVAFGDQIHVHEPTFPEQLVPAKPLFVIDILPSRPGLRGYIDPRKPQSPNHILVRQFGEDEILLIACDGGDVLAFRTHSIHKAYELQVNAGLGDRSLTGLVAPFFHENVGSSAWGIDVHTFERLIAVSANTHDIIVFAFALSSSEREDDLEKSGNVSINETDLPDAKEGESSNDEQDEDELPPGPAPLSSVWRRPKHSSSALDRSRTNFAWRLSAHTTNIPSIAFVNFPPKKSSSISLVSTDISGQTLLWDVWKAESQVIPVLHARGWAVLCLDPHAAWITSTAHETFGGKLAPDHTPDHRIIFPPCTEISPDRLADNSNWHPGYGRFVNAENITAALVGNAMNDLPVMSLSEPEDSEGDAFLDDPASDDESVQGETTEMQGVLGDETLFFSDLANQDENASLPDQGSPTQESDGSLQEETDNEGGVELTTEDVNTSIPDLHDPSFESDTEANQILQQVYNIHQESSQSPTQGRGLSGERPTHVATSNGYNKQLLGPSLPCNLLIAGNTDIHFERHSSRATSARTKSRTRFFCQEPLSQNIPPGMLWLKHCERLNMAHVIPQLGVLVLGNQVGRVGVFRLTYNPAKRQYGFRREAILPRKSEEDRGVRPDCPLYGIAVGPVQGTMSGKESPSVEGVGIGRAGDFDHPHYRLLVMYYDHTVLSYEISRPAPQDEVIVI